MIDKTWWVDEAKFGAAKTAIELLESYGRATGRRPCELIRIPDLGGPPTGNPELRRFIQSSIPGCHVIVYPWQPGPVLDGFPSWLFKVSPEGRHYRILVDWELVRNVAGNRIDIVTAKLTLHEFAHLHYHRESLCRPWGRALPATWEQEDQAWCFAVAIFGICLGDYARWCRENGEPDKAWRLA